MDSFFKSYTTEEARDELFYTHEQAIRGAADYIERFYNPHCLHSSLDYRSPIDFEHAIAKTSVADHTR